MGEPGKPEVGRLARAAAHELDGVGPQCHAEQAADGLEVLEGGVVPVPVEAGVPIPGPGPLPGVSGQFGEFVNDGFDDAGHGPYLLCREGADAGGRGCARAPASRPGLTGVTPDATPGGAGAVSGVGVIGGAAGKVATVVTASSTIRARYAIGPTNRPVGHRSIRRETRLAAPGRVPARCRATCPYAVGC